MLESSSSSSASARNQGLTTQVAQQALEWMFALQAEPKNETTRQAWQLWRAAKPEHEHAWQRIETVNQRLQPLQNSRLASAAQQALTRPAGASRRRMLKTLALMGFIGGGAWLAWQQQHQWQPLLAQYRTKHGERRRLTLEDGTQLVLNSDTAVNVLYNADQRQVQLLAGEILIVTGQDTPYRPFFVQTPQGLAQALGTHYRVRLLNEASEVDVYEGQVKLVPARAQQDALILQAGQSSRLRQDSVAAVSAVNTHAAAWQDGMLIASQMRLDDFVRELNRYSPQDIDYTPDVAALVLSGSYPLNDIDRLLQTLPQALPVRVDTISRRWGGTRRLISAR